MLSVSVKAQSGDVVVSGIVTDQADLSLPGVTVLSGTPLKALTSTNVRGEFRVSVPPGTKLVFRLCYKTS